MVALRRGIPHYAEGDENTLSAQPPVQTQRPLASTSSMPVAASAAPAMPVMSAASAASAAPSGFSQLMSGQYTAAQQNPNASPLTQWFAQKQIDAQNQQRALDLTAIRPSAFEIAREFIGGTPDSFSDVLKRYDTAQKLGDPLVQQHLMNNPDHLAEAERDPHTYAANITPEFRKNIEQAVQTHHDIKTNGVVHADEYGTFVKAPVDPAGVAKIVTTTGATPAQAHGALEPHQYSRDEFIRVMSGMPMKTVQMLFGAQLAQHLTPQQQAVNDYMKELRAPLEALSAKYNAETDEKKRKAIKTNYDKEYEDYKKHLGVLAKGYQAPFGVVD